MQSTPRRYKYSDTVIQLVADEFQLECYREMRKIFLKAIGNVSTKDIAIIHSRA